MLISLPRDESTILLMDLHLTKILAVGKPNFIEVNRIINIARSALGVFLGGRVGRVWGPGDRRWCFAKTESNVWVWLGRGAEEKNTFFVVSSPTPPAHLVYLTRGGKMSSNVSLHYQYCKLEVQTLAGNRISVRRWDGWSRGAIFYKFWKSFFYFEPRHLDSCWQGEEAVF